MTPILLLLLATLTAQAATFTGKVVGVSDGDTITALEVLGSRPKDAQDAIRAAMTMLGLNKPGDELVRVSLQDGK